MELCGAHFKRFKFIMFFLTLWAAVITVRLFYFSIINREQALVQMEHESLERKTIRALRGRIMSVDGDVLVRSKHIAQLVLSHKIQSHQLSALLIILEKEMKIKRRDAMLKVFKAPARTDVILKENLSLQEITQFSKSLGVNSYLKIKMTFFREQLVKDKQGRFGETIFEAGNFVGVSGYEKKYNELLRGQDLIYEVMVDKRGEVILKTFNELQKQEQGKDVFLTEKEWP
jgi:cell division protein FtsI/penicillin-binding protein 2